jgi:hypothetical protein
VQGLDVADKSPTAGGFECCREQDGVMEVGPVGGPPDRDADPIGEQGPLPSRFSPVRGVSTGPSPPIGALCCEPSTAASVRSSPMILP